VPGELGDVVSITAAPGEYEPGSFVLRADSDLTGVQVAASDLKGPEGVIRAEHIDIKVVKCWYQSEGAWTHFIRKGPGKVLVPELLLNDDTLVKVDTETPNNYVKLRFAEGDKYVWIDDPGTGDRRRLHYVDRSIEEFPVRDAETLRPVDIPVRSNKQFWLTLQVPEQSAAGVYAGTLRLRSAAGEMGEIGLKVRVLPFRLSEPRTHYDPTVEFTSSIYTQMQLDPTGVGRISASKLSEQQFRNVCRDMARHGVTEPMLYHGRKWVTPLDTPEGQALLRKAIAIGRAEGLWRKALYFHGFCTNTPRSEEGELLGWTAESWRHCRRR